MTDTQNKIMCLANAQARGIVTAMMKGNESFDDTEVVQVILAFASATQEAEPGHHGLEQAIVNSAFETFNGFCVAADSENTRLVNLKYFIKLFPKSKQHLKPKDTKAERVATKTENNGIKIEIFGIDTSRSEI